jgi:hypothetical protein
MNRRVPDLEKLRAELRRLRRGDLLIIVERALELVPSAKLKALVGGFVPIEPLAATESGAVSLLDEVRKFHAESMNGQCYESFAVNSRNFTQKSERTEAFIAELDRLLGMCIRVAAKRPRSPMREALELLFALLRHIDKGHDDVIFFADEGGSRQVGVDWRPALAAYFRCLADGASAEEFAHAVDQAIKAFAEYERPRHLAAARRVASAAQRAALGAVTPARR